MCTSTQPLEHISRNVSTGGHQQLPWVCRPVETFVLSALVLSVEVHDCALAPDHGRSNMEERHHFRRRAAMTPALDPFKHQGILQYHPWCLKKRVDDHARPPWHRPLCQARATSLEQFFDQHQNGVAASHVLPRCTCLLSLMARSIDGHCVARLRGGLVFFFPSSWFIVVLF